MLKFVLKWLLFLGLVVGYSYLVFFREWPVPSSLVPAQLEYFDSSEALPFTEDSTTESMGDSVVIEFFQDESAYLFATDYAVLSGSFKEESKAQKHQQYLASKYISGKVIFTDTKHTVLLKETNSMNSAQSFKADMIALGVSARIRSNQN